MKMIFIRFRLKLCECCEKSECCEGTCSEIDSTDFTVVLSRAGWRASWYTMQWLMYPVPTYIGYSCACMQWNGGKWKFLQRNKRPCPWRASSALVAHSNHRTIEFSCKKEKRKKESKSIWIIRCNHSSPRVNRFPIESFERHQVAALGMNGESYKWWEQHFNSMWFSTAAGSDLQVKWRRCDAEINLVENSFVREHCVVDCAALQQCLRTDFHLVRIGMWEIGEKTHAHISAVLMSFKSFFLLFFFFVERG